MLAITQNLVTEWSFASKTRYDDPFNDVQLDVLFTDENGEERLVPAFWTGESIWRVRFSAPKGFHTLALDRVEKGFSVVLIVAGLYPDMPAFDERGANEAGFPWDTDYSSINPDYWNLADRRISHMVDLGLTPCIVGCWGYHLRLKGIEEGVRCRAFLFNPSTGDEQDIGDVVPDANGDWDLPLGNGPWRMMPIYQDWVLVLERTER